MPEEPDGRRKDARSPEEIRKHARELLADWRSWLGEGLDQVETLTKEKPAASLALAFLAGILSSLLFRRK